MFIKWTHHGGYVTVILKDKISAYVVAPNGEVTVFVGGATEENGFLISLYKGHKEIAEKVMMDVMRTDSYIVELPTLDKIKEYLDGENKNS